MTTTTPQFNLGSSGGEVLRFSGDALRAAAAAWRPMLTGAWAPLLGLTLLALAISPAFGLAPLRALLLAPVDLLVTAVAYGAMMRVALADLHVGDESYRLGPGGLQWTSIETRLLGALLLIGLFVGLAGLGAIFATLLSAVVVAAVIGQPSGAVGGFLATPSGIAAALVCAVTVGFILWAGVRLILSTAATADRRQVQVFSTWSLTKGAALPLFLALLAIAAPAILFSLAGRMAAGQAVALAPWAGYALAVGLVQTPLTAGVSAYAYRRLREPAQTAEAHN
jgi:hypothetical protein